MKSFSRNLKSIFYGVALVVGTPAVGQSVETTIGPDGEEIDIVTITQTEAANYFIQATKNLNEKKGGKEKYESFSQALTAEFTKLISKRLGEKYNLSEKYSKGIAFSMGKLYSLDYYSPYEFSPLNGMHTTTSNEMTEKLGVEFERRFCIAGQTDVLFSIREWVEALNAWDEDNLPSFPRLKNTLKMSQYMQAFANAHERAHCYSPAEFNAEYIAAADMLRTAEDIDGVKNFLTLVMATRQFGSTYAYKNFSDMGLAMFVHYKLERATYRALYEYEQGVRYKNYNSILKAAKGINWEKEFLPGEQLKENAAYMKRLQGPRV